MLQQYGCFGLSLLGPQHQAVADRFSGRGGQRGAQRFAGADWVGEVTGAPLLADAMVAFDCRVEEMLDRATHTILIGRIEAIRTAPTAGALIYWHGDYRAMEA